MRQIAIYGKGGIGKSTVSANLSASFSDMGLEVLQIGCDPKHDSTRMLMRGRWIPTVLDQLYKKQKLEPTDIVFTGYGNVRCVEAGGPEPGIGCAGRGIIATFQLLEKLNLLYGDVVIYDVLGDVVCGGFAMPMRNQYAKEIYLVTSGELMSIYAANNICKAIERISENSHSNCKLGGIICNSKDTENELELVTEFADRIGSKLIQYIPRNKLVQLSEINQKTVIEYAPDSDQSNIYRKLANTIYTNNNMSIPTPLELAEIEKLVREFI
ncbi:MAG TPA: Ni-sirohydrochlorin a,c-diamide reductive cyclase ATP-dependent reductase subunit [Methanocorpusculum sp.]|nr:Ni-sirohydrochlorin a,c-diamide reductive cyclase ATP-dependent reductase subunit [Methanocorpusculum sp.]